jgi:uncharacterized protein (DUF2062 family)
MFRRRTPLTRINQIRSFIWPERGFRRLFAYFFQRVVRMPGTSASIAAGMASGVAASFTPFVGLHLLIAALLAILFRGNVLASAIGTFFGNPWTFLFIWVSDYRLGLWLLQQSGYGEQLVVLSFQQLTEVMTTVIKFFTFSTDVDWQQMTMSLEQVFLPMAIGGMVLAVVAWLVAFVLTFYSLEVWRAHRAKRMAQASLAAKSRKKNPL